MLGAETYKYGKPIEEMKNDAIRKKDPFPKTIREASHILSKSTNNYGGKYNNWKSDSNYGMAFATVTEKKQTDLGKVFQMFLFIEDEIPFMASKYCSAN